MSITTSLSRVAASAVVALATTLLPFALQAQPQGIENRSYAELEALAENGYPAAMIEVGKRLCQGRGVVKDELQGLAWFETARHISGEDNWQEKTAQQCEVFYEGINESMLDQVKEMSGRQLSRLKDRGAILETPSTILVLALDYLRSSTNEDKVRGLALLYTAAGRFPTDPKDPLPGYAATLIESTEALMGKSGTIEAQSMASRLKYVNRDGSAKGLYLVRGAPRDSYLAALKVLDHEKALKEEEKLLELDAATQKLRPVTSERAFAPRPKTWTERLSKFFGLQ